MTQQGKRIQGSRRPGQKKPQVNVEKKVNRLFIQLIASALLFLLVFVGSGLIPEHVFDVFSEVGQVIGGDSLLLDTVQTLGDAISEGENLSVALKEWCVETFLPSQVDQPSDLTLEQHLDVSEQFRRHLLPELTAPIE